MSGPDQLAVLVRRLGSAKVLAQQAVVGIFQLLAAGSASKAAPAQANVLRLLEQDGAGRAVDACLSSRNTVGGLVSPRTLWQSTPFRSTPPL